MWIARSSRRCISGRRRKKRRGSGGTSAGSGARRRTISGRSWKRWGWSASCSARGSRSASRKTPPRSSISSISAQRGARPSSRKTPARGCGAERGASAGPPHRRPGMGCDPRRPRSIPGRHGSRRRAAGLYELDGGPSGGGCGGVGAHPPRAAPLGRAGRPGGQIGRAGGRGRGWISVGGGSFKKKKKHIVVDCVLVVVNFLDVLVELVRLLVVVAYSLALVCLRFTLLTVYCDFFIEVAGARHASA